MAGKIFINYRRGDDPQAAGRLFDRLEEVFGRERLFMDVDSIEPGLDFVRVLEAQVAQCDVLISVIGRNWIDARDESGARRLDNPDDFVRIEIESALTQDKRVIPVLVGQASMPRASELPESMQSLVRRHAVRLTHDRFRADADALIAVLGRALSVPSHAPPKPHRRWHLPGSALLIGSLVGVLVIGAIGIWVAMAPRPVTVASTPGVAPTPAPATAQAPATPTPPATAPAPAPATPTPAPSAPIRPIANTSLSAAQERALKPGDTFQECANCPVMKVLPAGSFTMGSPAREPGRRVYESPQHGVTIERPFAIGKFDVTRDQFSAFVNDVGYDAGSSCYVLSGNDWILRNGQSWSDPGFAQTGSDPVACIEWRVAQAYVNWLRKTTGKAYRLLSESEWEYAARAGTTTVYYWGNAVGINNADCSGCGSEWNGGTAPAGSFPANPFGLYDMTGNVFQWVADCWNQSYIGAPADGSPWTSGDCTLRVVRGGSWLSPPRYFRSAYRNGVPSGNRAYDLGFRIARTLTP